MDSSTGNNNTNNNIASINIILLMPVKIAHQTGGARNNENKILKQTLKELRHNKKLLSQDLKQKIQKTKDDKKNDPLSNLLPNKYKLQKKEQQEIKKQIQSIKQKINEHPHIIKLKEKKIAKHQHN